MPKTKTNNLSPEDVKILIDEMESGLSNDSDNNFTEEDLKLLKELEELNDQNNGELSPEEVKIQIDEMESDSDNNFTEEDLKLLKQPDQEESYIELNDYNPRIELRKFGENLKKDLAETNPKPSVESPAGSKTDKSTVNREGEGGCCSIS